MIRVAPGNIVSTTIDFASVTGGAAQSVTASVLDADDGLIEQAIVTFVPGATEAQIETSTLASTLPEGVTFEARSLFLSIVTMTGSFEERVIFEVARSDRIAHLSNSFGAYTRLLTIASEMSALDGWASADDAQRQIALVDAFRKITRYSLAFQRFTSDFGPTVATRFLTGSLCGVIRPEDWPLVTPDYWSSLPEKFRIALMRAQIMEANAILDPDERELQRSAGIMSESIGESSVMLMSGKPLVRDMSKRTFRELRGIVISSPRVGRS